MSYSKWDSYCSLTNGQKLVTDGIGRDRDVSYSHGQMG
jgi:hypothetical protein